MGRLLQHRDARIYLAGQILSVLGDSALWLAMGIWVKQRTGSNSAAGLVFFAFICGTCLAPLTGLGGGAVLGGLLAAPVLARTSERLLVGSGLLACALSCLAATAGRLALVLAGGALLGVCIVWINVGAITLVQRQTPARLLGRVDAAANALVTLPQAVSIAVGAAAVAVLDYRILLAVMAAVMLAAAGYLARVPGSRLPTATRDIVAASNRVQR